MRQRAGDILTALWHLDGLIVGGLVAMVVVIAGKRDVPTHWRVMMLLIPTLLLALVGYLVVFSVG
jgi:hypothetical protein